MPLLRLSHFYIRIVNPHGGRGDGSIGPTYPAYRRNLGLTGIVTALRTSGRNCAEILKYGAAFNMLNRKSKGATLLQTNGRMGINNCAIHFGLKKLTHDEMTTPPWNFGAPEVDARRNDNPPGNLL